MNAVTLQHPGYAIRLNGGEVSITSTGAVLIKPASGQNTTINNGNLVFGEAVTRIVPGVTSLSLRNNANNADNVLITDAGVVTVRSDLKLATAISKVVPGATSLSLRNNADNADNILITDAGVVTVRSDFTLATAISKIIPGATSLSLRNNADNADNLILTDAGAATFRSTVGGITTLTVVTNIITPLLTGTAGATSLIVASHVTGGAAAQRDVIVQTGNAANPQTLVTRLTFGSNAAQGSSTITSMEQVIVPNGAAATPGIRTTTSAHGLFESSTSTLAFAVGGVEAMRLGSAVAGRFDLAINTTLANQLGNLTGLASSNNVRIAATGANIHARFIAEGDSTASVWLTDLGATVNTRAWGMASDANQLTWSYLHETTGVTTSVVVLGVNLVTLSGATSITPTAVAAGDTALTITPGAHTALVAEKTQFVIAASTQTLTDTTTIALVRYATLGALTLQGVAAGGAEVVTTAISLEIALPVQGANLTITNAPVAARFMGNIIVGNVLPPAAGPTNTILVASGTAPSTSPADSVTFYSSDSSVGSGHTIPSFYCEGTDVLASGQVDSASSVRVKMRINGTEVTLLAI